jgi:hypothetical protein
MKKDEFENRFYIIYSDVNGMAEIIKAYTQDGAAKVMEDYLEIYDDVSVVFINLYHGSADLVTDEIRAIIDDEDIEHGDSDSQCDYMLEQQAFGRDS